MSKIQRLKRVLISILVLASLCFLLILVAPALLGLNFPLDGFMCNGAEKVCVKMSVAEPIRPTEPVSTTITVIGARDIPELHVNLSSYQVGDVGIEEEPGCQSIQGGVAWISSVQPFHRLTYTCKIHLPLIEGEYIPGQSGGYQLIDLKASIWVPGHNPINDGLTIFITSQGGKAYEWGGKPIPITPGPQPLVTPGPSPTFIPTLTLMPTPTP